MSELSNNDAEPKMPIKITNLPIGTEGFGLIWGIYYLESPHKIPNTGSNKDLSALLRQIIGTPIITGQRLNMNNDDSQTHASPGTLIGFDQNLKKSECNYFPDQIPSSIGVISNAMLNMKLIDINIVELSDKIEVLPILRNNKIASKLIPQSERHFDKAYHVTSCDSTTMIYVSALVERNVDDELIRSILITFHADSHNIISAKGIRNLIMMAVANKILEKNKLDLKSVNMLSLDQNLNKSGIVSAMVLNFFA